MAAPGRCVEYIFRNGLEDVHAIHTAFSIVTLTEDVRLDVGLERQAREGRVRPNMDFCQMNVGQTRLALDNDHLSGNLWETARPVLDEGGRDIMEGSSAFRGKVEDYRVSDTCWNRFRPSALKNYDSMRIVFRFGVV